MVFCYGSPSRLVDLERQEELLQLYLFWHSAAPPPPRPETPCSLESHCSYASSALNKYCLLLGLFFKAREERDSGENGKGSKKYERTGRMVVSWKPKEKRILVRDLWKSQEGWGLRNGHQIWQLVIQTVHSMRAAGVGGREEKSDRQNFTFLPYISTACYILP